eukprot:Gb_05280 [translate_table: standard]
MSTKYFLGNIDSENRQIDIDEEMAGIEIGIGGKPSEELKKRRSMHCLSKIKPQMLQQVLAFRGLLESKVESKDSGVSDRVEYPTSVPLQLMPLFPEHAGFDSTPTTNLDSKLHTKSIQEGYEIAPKSPFLQDHYSVPTSTATLRSSASAASPGKRSAPQLTIFYNGSVNAEAIRLAAAGSNQNSLHENPSGRDYLYIPGSDASNRNPFISSSVPTTAITDYSTTPLFDSKLDLPIARKRSLQRLLKKRKDRLNSVAPYTTSSKLKPFSLCN